MRMSLAADGRFAVHDYRPRDRIHFDAEKCAPGRAGLMKLPVAAASRFEKMVAASGTPRARDSFVDRGDDGG